jgi:transcriptional regulator with XRE-family HTH domain
MGERDGWVSFSPEALREIRLELDYSLATTASLGGPSIGTVWALETGRREPTLAALQRLCRAYELTISFDQDGIWIRREPLSHDS